MSSRTRTAVLVGTVAVISGLVSLGRILAANHDALRSLVWAEDGLFPLCVRAHDALSCLADPFAGYLLFLPRVVAIPVSWFPLDAWPAATNIAAALLAAGASAVAAIVVRTSGAGVVATGFVALLPTLLPIVGLEAINTTGSVYMLLVFVAALAVCFPPGARFPTAAYAIGAAIVGLTIPSSALLLLPLAIQVWRRRIPRTGGLVTGATLALGLAAQSLVALTAASPRSMNWSADAAKTWADSLPSAFLTLWPTDVGLTITGSLSPGTTVIWDQTGIVLVLLVLVSGVALTLLRNPTGSGVGLMLILGLGMGVIPAAAGHANNRYFVIPVLLWLSAGFIALDRWLPRGREVVMASIAAVLVLLWIPQFPASEFRSTDNPDWASVLAQTRAECTKESVVEVAVTFSPAWPFPDAAFLGPTNNIVPCSVLAP